MQRSHKPRSLVRIQVELPNNMTHNLKDLVKGNVYFVEYRKGNLWYQAGRHTLGGTFMFPVPIEDTGDATFMSIDKGILFMRYIRKHLESIADGNTVHESTN
jgi:hypothetical protein